MLMMTVAKIKDIINSKNPCVQDMITVSQLLSTEGAWVIEDGHAYWKKGANNG